MSAAAEYVFFVVFAAILVAVYFLPSIVAIKRQHQSKISIIILNTFFGLTVAGWFAALIWAAGAVRPGRTRGISG
jgi:T4 superinfection immunity protein